MCRFASALLGELPMQYTVNATLPPTHKHHVMLQRSLPMRCDPVFNATCLALVVVPGPQIARTLNDPIALLSFWDKVQDAQAYVAALPTTRGRAGGFL